MSLLVTDYIHPKLRPYQKETLEAIQKSKARYIILQAPTGSGKSFFPAQLAADGYKVLACVRTKSLQQQYVNSYDFVELFGKGNYDCLEFGQQQELDDFVTYKSQAKADLCTVPKSFKGQCKATCPYPLARQDFIGAPAGTLNYSKFLLDRPVVEQFRPHYLFLDEAHELSDLVVDFSGIVLNWKMKKIKRYAEPILINSPQPIAIREGYEYLNSLFHTLDSSVPRHPSKGGNRKEYKDWERLKEKIEITLAAMDIEPESWYVYSDKKHLIAKPLTGRFHFTRLLERARKIVLMSATIGKIPYFIRELGIKDYEFINVPNIWPSPLRPIEDLKAPRMGHKSPEEDWLKHSQIIADRINQCPDNWTGLVHSPSRWLTWDMAERLEKMTGRPIFVPKEEWGTERAAEEWLKVEDNGTICVSWMFWEGIDCKKDRINIVAKIPFINFADEFDKARFMFDAKSGYGRVSNKLTQGLGRIRRGNVEDYGNNKVVAIGDSNWKRLKKYIQQDILASII